MPFIEKSYKKKHEQVHCQKTDAVVTVDPIPVSILELANEEPLGGDGNVADVLSRFRTDKVGLLCVKDQTLVHFERMLCLK